MAGWHSGMHHSSGCLMLWHEFTVLCQQKNNYEQEVEPLTYCATFGFGRWRFLFWKQLFGWLRGRSAWQKKWMFAGCLHWQMPPKWKLSGLSGNKNTSHMVNWGKLKGETDYICGISWIWNFMSSVAEHVVYKKSIKLYPLSVVKPLVCATQQKVQLIISRLWKSGQWTCLFSRRSSLSAF